MTCNQMRPDDPKDGIGNQLTGDQTTAEFYSYQMIA